MIFKLWFFQVVLADKMYEKWSELEKLREEVDPLPWLGKWKYRVFQSDCSTALYLYHPNGVQYVAVYRDCGCRGFTIFLEEIEDTGCIRFQDAAHHEALKGQDYDKV